MAAAKKKTRKELLKEPDEFITLTARFIGWFDRNRTAVSRVALGLAVLAVLFAGYRFYDRRAEARSAELFGQAVAKYERLAREQTPEAARQAVAPDLGAVVEAGANRSGGRLARLMLAELSHAAGDHRRAAELYAAALDGFRDSGFLQAQILISLGHVHAALGEDAAAIGYFERALAVAAPAQKAEILFHLGALHERMGNAEKGRESLRRIVAEHPDSLYVELVRERIGG